MIKKIFNTFLLFCIFLLTASIVFSYDLTIAKENFEKADCKLITLSDYNFLIRKAVETNYINESDIQSLVRWRENPKKW